MAPMILFGSWSVLCEGFPWSIGLNILMYKKEAAAPKHPKVATYTSIQDGIKPRNSLGGAIFILHNNRCNVITGGENYTLILPFMF